MLVAGLITAAIAGVAVWLQVAFLALGNQTKRFKLMTLDWPEELGTIEGKERIRLEDAPAKPVAPSILADRRAELKAAE